MKTLFIGIDPGKSGGIAYIDTEQGFAATEPYSDKALIELCSEASKGWHEVICCLEKVGAMPGARCGFNVHFRAKRGLYKRRFGSLQNPLPRDHPTEMEAGIWLDFGQS